MKLLGCEALVVEFSAEKKNGKSSSEHFEKAGDKSILHNVVLLSEVFGM